MLNHTSASAQSPIPDSVRTAPSLTVQDLANLRAEFATYRMQAQDERRALLRLLNAETAESQRLRVRISQIETQIAPPDTSRPTALPEAERATLVEYIISEDPEKQRALAAIERGAFSEGFDIIEARARQLAQIAEVSREPSALVRAAASWSELGRLAYQRDLPRAFRAYQEAARLNPADASAPTELGNLYLMRGETTQGLRQGELALARASTNPERIGALGVLGGVAQQTGAAARQRQLAQEALALARDNAAQNNDDEARTLLSQTLDALSQLLSVAGDLGAALPLAEEANRIDVARLAELPNEPSRRLYAAMGYGRLADIRERMGQRDLALRDEAQWRAMFEALVRDYPQDLYYKYNLAVVFNNEFAREARLGNWHAAAAPARRSADLFREIAQAERGNTANQLLFAVSLQGLTTTLVRDRRVDEALEAAQECVEIANRTPSSNAYAAQLRQIARDAVNNLSSHAQAQRNGAAVRRAEALLRRLRD